jgi:hypothetical protein
MNDHEAGIRARRRRRAAPWCAAALAAAGCTHTVKVEPIRIDPIYVTLDVRLKVDRELDSFFDFQDQAAPPADAAGSPGERGS